MKDETTWQKDEVNIGNAQIAEIMPSALENMFMNKVKSIYPFIKSEKQIRNAMVKGKSVNPCIIQFEYRLPNIGEL